MKFKNIIKSTPIIIILFCCCIFSPAHAVTLTVGPGEAYTTIQSAIDAATAGDTVYVKNGTYTENLTINKKLSLEAESNVNTIITAAAAGTIVNITSAEVGVNNFNITSGRADTSQIISGGANYLTVTNCKIHDITNTSGITGISGRSYFKVSNNEIYNLVASPTTLVWVINCWGGHMYINITNNNIHDTTAKTNGLAVSSGAISFSNGSGTTQYHYPDWNVVSGNTISNVSGFGVLASYGPIYTYYVIFENNYIHNVTNDGIRLSNASDNHNIIRYNTFDTTATYPGAGWNAINVSGSNNQIYGNVFKDTLYSPIGFGGTSHNNTMCQNIFVNSGANWDTSSAKNNVWYNGSTGRGNYYPYWYTPDANDDGIVDTPYTVPGGTATSDAYPLAISKSYFHDGSQNIVTSYNYQSGVYVAVRDFCMNLNSGVAETITATVTNETSTDSEIVTLTETGINTGIFSATVSIARQSASANNGTIAVVDGDNTFKLNYVNRYDGTNTSSSTVIMDVTRSPSNCALGSITNSSMAVSWTDNSDNETGFSIEKSEDGAAYTQIGTVAANATSYSGAGTTGLSINTRYWYRVRAERSGMYSGYSTADNFTLTNAPTADAFSNVTSSVIRAKWGTNSNPGGTEYYCENTTAGTNSGVITGLYWDSSGLIPKTSYSFRVQSRNGDGVVSSWVDLGSQEAKEVKSPNSLKVNGVNLIAGDIINGLPAFEIKVEGVDISSLGKINLAAGSDIDVSTFKVYIDDVLMTDGTLGRYDSYTGSGRDITFFYTCKTALSAGEHKIVIEVYDNNGTIYMSEVSGIKVMSGGVAGVGPVLCYPSPYDNSKGNLKIGYNLSVDANTTVYIFDLLGRLVYKVNYSSGQMGGKAGYNQIEWSGKDTFGSLAENDAYLIRITDTNSGNLLGKSKVMIVKGR